MRLILFLTTLFISSLAVEAKTLIVTDLDDTLKVTNVLNKKEAVYNALFSKKAFSGMPELLREFNREDTVIAYVSGSPPLIESTIQSFLEFQKLPQINNIFLKPLASDTYRFKVSTIAQIINNVKPDRIILIGDDTQHDPDVYDKIAQDFAVDSIYIHVVANRPLPVNEKIVSYFSAVEIAGVEFFKSSMTFESLKKVGHAFLSQDRDSLIAIPKRYCPENGRESIEEFRQRATTQTMISLMEKVQKKIIETCKI